jgi:hypothetical protein
MPYIRCANFDTCRSYALKTLADNKPGRKTTLCPACLKARNRRQGAARQAAYAQRIKERQQSPNGTLLVSNETMGPKTLLPPDNSVPVEKINSASAEG